MDFPDIKFFGSGNTKFGFYPPGGQGDAGEQPEHLAEVLPEGKGNCFVPRLLTTIPGKLSVKLRGEAP